MGLGLGLPSWVAFYFLFFLVLMVDYGLVVVVVVVIVSGVGEKCYLFVFLNTCE